MHYPPGHQNCSEAGCHGPRPYEDGFQVPTIVPAVIGSGELDAYGDAGVLGAYIRAAMPRQASGSLDETTHWEIAAFLLRANGVGVVYAELGAGNASDFRLDQASASADDTLAPTPEATSKLLATPLATPTPDAKALPALSNPAGGLAVGALIEGLFVVLVVGVWRGRRRSS